jgi:hypothetical protein
MFSADLEFEDRDAPGASLELEKIDKVKLHASRIDSGPWREFDEVRKANLGYLHNVLLSQYRWRSRFV